MDVFLSVRMCACIQFAHLQFAHLQFAGDFRRFFNDFWWFLMIFEDPKVLTKIERKHLIFHNFSHFLNYFSSLFMNFLEFSGTKTKHLEKNTWIFWKNQEKFRKSLEKYWFLWTFPEQFRNILLHDNILE